MNNIITFEDKLNYNCGSKFNNLAKLHQNGILVPKALCVTADMLAEEVEKYLDSKDEFYDIFMDIESTSGCYLVDTYPEIEKRISGFHFSEEAISQINSSIEDSFNNSENIKFAIRSSASHEDGENNSFAGIYETFLNVQRKNIIEKMECAIVAYYNYQSIISRIRTGNYSGKIELNIIIQEMVDSKISGVAFSTSSVTNGFPMVEWVEGLGENLVSGEVEANIYWKNGEDKRNSGLLDLVIEGVEKIKSIMGYEVDTEWCSDGSKLFFVQARPITDEFTVGKKKTSIFEVDRLYFENNLEYANKLQKCENVYKGYVSKRSPKYILAQKNGIRTGKGYVLHFNLKGLLENKEAVCGFCDGDYFEKFDIDVDENIRQNIIEKDTLWDYLMSLFGGYNETIEHTMIIREFISGEMGCISHLMENGNVYVEYSKDGLFTMNRGLAQCECTELASDISLEDKEPWWEDIRKFTKALNNTSLMIEWVICRNKAFFIDYSEEFQSAEMEVGKTINKIIMPGNVSGPVLYLDDTEVLKKLSLSPGVSVHDINEKLINNPKFNIMQKKISSLDEKPIIFAEKPYAVLSLLFDDAAGFVFKSGSLLCHLSILIREAKIPAIVCKDEFENIANDSSEVMLVNGNVEVIS